MNVLLISPAYPAEMREFTRGLSEVGARVIGVGDSPAGGLPAETQRHLSAYVQVANLWDETAVVHQLGDVFRRARIDRVECLWEPGMMLAARVREAYGVPGLNVAQTVPLRDKEEMKQVLDRAGIRTPRHARARTTGEVWAAAERIGYPLIVKPIAGAGATNTYPVGDAGELERIIPLLRSVDEVSVEEFIEGEELTFDTVCANGEVFYYNMSWYRPRPLDGKLNEWISPQAIALRDVEAPALAGGRRMGFAVLEALGLENGFTHMEWYLTASGEAVFGEIGGRPPGARMVDLMNFSCDFDIYRGWAEAVCHGRFSQPVRRRYNAAIIFKRALGQGRIQRIEGLESLLAHYGQHIALVDLLPVGAMRRNWKQQQISDGFVVVRHPDLDTTLEMADAVGVHLRLYAQ